MWSLGQGKRREHLDAQSAQIREGCCAYVHIGVIHGERCFRRRLATASKMDGADAHYPRHRTSTALDGDSLALELLVE
jgi:hypothetical protein